MGMVRLRWFPEAMLSEDIKQAITHEISRLDFEEIERLNEYEESGDAILLPRPDIYKEGIYAKVVKHRGRIMLVIGQGEHDFVEEYYVAEVVKD